MFVETGKPITVWYSCGVASAVAAKLTLEKYSSTNPIRIVNTPIAEEPLDNRRFLKDCEDWLGVPIEIAVSTEYPDSSAVSVWTKVKAMSFIQGAPCTNILKKKTRQEWEKVNGITPEDYLVLGFTLDERGRYDRFCLTERQQTIPVLIDAGLTKQDCFDLCLKEGLRLPDSYLRGYPNANCIGCPKATSPTYWNHVRKDSPEVFEARAKQSRELGVRLVRVKGKRIFLDELDPEAMGRPMASLVTPDCGIFCEEQD